MEAISTVNLANPGNGVPLPAGTPAIVDETDPFIKAHLDAGYLIPSSSGARQEWTEDTTTPIDTGAISDLGGTTEPPPADAPAAKTTSSKTKAE